MNLRITNGREKKQGFVGYLRNVSWKLKQRLAMAFNRLKEGLAFERDGGALQGLRKVRIKFCVQYKSGFKLEWASRIKNLTLG
ncbi:hypothetical protein E5676_scaffold265G00100 [Cucumis melo var. makuwa]|uniref:Uncharacterized protein n=1 Tax=Cucumis melo var. makuwa TaxID=1194695 RepID=A0A5A7U3B5_CUCMM|nr:hypothetical protein E6C27_scaffold43G00200 [Cucumis melo var. makuwa]TYK07900.1 hypothetical protein E5676_scaffold265G00100 [Cucumis melo var. makuwa]